MRMWKFLMRILLKIVDQEGDRRISFGNCKLLMFEKSGESRQNGNLAVKYVKKAPLKAEEFIGDDFVLYLTTMTC